MRLVNFLSNLAMPIVILGIVAFGLKEKVKVFDTFLEGAKEGVEIEGIEKMKLTQILGNILHRKIINNSIYGKMITGEDVVCTIKENGNNILVTILSNDPNLSQMIAKEILKKVEYL